MYYVIDCHQLQPWSSSTGRRIVIPEGRNRRAGKEVPGGESVPVEDAQLPASRRSVRRPPTSLWFYLAIYQVGGILSDQVDTHGFLIRFELYDGKRLHHTPYG